jgi:hypothetical protein
VCLCLNVPSHNAEIAATCTVPRLKHKLRGQQLRPSRAPSHPSARSPCGGSELPSYQRYVKNAVEVNRELPWIWIDVGTPSTRSTNPPQDLPNDVPLRFDS